jgi:Na+/H+ antiporter NhaD/arsenite permease-like protein
MRYLPGIFALLVAAAGWYYLFYSSAARKLAGVEDAATNQLRIRLRRVCGVVMMLMAVAFYAGTVAFSNDRVREAGWLYLAMMVLMGAMVVLGLVDLRLTNRLRRHERRNRSEDR